MRKLVCRAVCGLATVFSGCDDDADEDQEAGVDGSTYSVPDSGTGTTEEGWSPFGSSIVASHLATDVALVASDSDIYVSVARSEGTYFGTEGSEGRTLCPLQHYVPDVYQWQPVNEVNELAEGEYLSSPRLAIASDGSVYLLRHHLLYTGDMRISLEVVRPDADTLEVIDDAVATSNSDLSSLTLSVEGSGRVDVGWLSANQTYIQTYEGSGEELNVDGFAISGQLTESLVLVAGEKLHAVVSERATNDPMDGYQLRVYSLNDAGTELENRGDLYDLTNSIPTAVSAAIDADGDVFVAYEERENGAGGASRVRVKKLPAGQDATGAVDMSPDAETYPIADTTRLVAGADGKVWLGILPEPDDSRVAVLEWDGSAWQELSAGDAGQRGAISFDLAYAPAVTSLAAGILRVTSFDDTTAGYWGAEAESYQP